MRLKATYDWKNITKQLRAEGFNRQLTKKFEEDDLATMWSQGNGVRSRIQINYRRKIMEIDPPWGRYIWTTLFLIVKRT